LSYDDEINTNCYWSMDCPGMIVFIHAYYPIDYVYIYICMCVCKINMYVYCVYIVLLMCMYIVCVWYILYIVGR
jgi:hypothetical protein